MSDLKNILNNDEELSSEELMKYLEGTASDEERFSVEKQMADSSFVNDAVEGLQQFSDTGQLQSYAAQLNQQLRKQTSPSKRKKTRRGSGDQPWTLMAIVAILLLCTLGYLVIHLYQQKHKAPQQTSQPAPTGK